ncbi:MAG: hypothetical protein ACTHMZ_13400 [Actinomycetes bacterium]
MRMRLIVDAVQQAVGTALAGTPWEPEPRVPPLGEDDRDELPDRGTRLVWCGSYDAVRLLYPWLPQSHENQPGGCVDLWVHIDDAGLLSGVEFEGRSLAETFRLMQRPARAEQVEALLGHPADVVAPRLARHLVDALDESPATST